jgi:hypothetical protein
MLPIAEALEGGLEGGARSRHRAPRAIATVAAA